MRTLSIFGSVARDEASEGSDVDMLVEFDRPVGFFLRPDYLPRTDDERRRVLHAIQKHVDLERYKRAAKLQQWLSRYSGAASASS